VLPPSDGNITVIHVGERWRYDANYTVTQADIDANATLINRVRVDTNETTPAKEANASTAVAQDINYTVIKSTSSVPEKAGDTLIYIFDINNTGNVTLKDVNFTDPKCASTPVYQSGDTDGNSSVLSVGEVQEYNCTSIPVTQTEMDQGFVTNEVNVTMVPPVGPVTPAVEANVTTPVHQAPDYAVSKTETTGQDATHAGQLLQYTIVIENNGTVTLSDINITEFYPGAGSGQLSAPSLTAIPP